MITLEGVVMSLVPDLLHLAAFVVLVAAFMAARAVGKSGALRLLRTQVDELLEDLQFDVVAHRADPSSERVAALRHDARLLRDDPRRALENAQVQFLVDAPQITGATRTIDLRDSRAPLVHSPLTEHWARLTEIAHDYAWRALPLRTRLPVCRRLEVAQPAMRQRTAERREWVHAWRMVRIFGLGIATELGRSGAAGQAYSRRWERVI